MAYALRIIRARTIAGRSKPSRVHELPSSPAARRRERRRPPPRRCGGRERVLGASSLTTIGIFLLRTHRDHVCFRLIGTNPNRQKGLASGRDCR